MTVTERSFRMGDTPFVNMVRRACTNALFEPGDTKWPWKGEAAASFVCAGIASSRALPTSSADYWFPSILFHASASEVSLSFGGVFLPLSHKSECTNPDAPELFTNRCIPFEALQGGFYFHPNEQSPLVGDPGEEKAFRPLWLRCTAIGEQLYPRRDCVPAAGWSAWTM
jgi:hypothetical protein